MRIGFDGLDVAFKGTLPDELLEAFAEAKEEAQKKREDALVNVSKGFAVHVAESGARGGFAFRVDTGPDGETWFFKNDGSIDWNIRVSCKSAMLLKYGYEGAKQKLYDRLEAFGAYVEEASIGRVDYAIDFQAPDGFEIDPTLVVAHTNSTVDEHGAQISCIASRARRVETLTVGKMPGRQVTIYNKTAEIKKKGKTYWFKAWGLEEGAQVFRLEVRMGKDYLKRADMRTWEDVEANMKAETLGTLRKIRLCDPAKRMESNISRTGFHPLWQAAMAWLEEKWLWGYRACKEALVVEEERKRLEDIFNQQLTGSIISFATVCGTKKEDFKRFVEALSKRLDDFTDINRAKFNKKWRKSEDKYCFLTGHGGGYESAYATA